MLLNIYHSGVKATGQILQVPAQRGGLQVKWRQYYLVKLAIENSLRSNPALPRTIGGFSDISSAFSEDAICRPDCLGMEKEEMPPFPPAVCIASHYFPAQTATLCFVFVFVFLTVLVFPCPHFSASFPNP